VRGSGVGEQNIRSSHTYESASILPKCTRDDLEAVISLASLILEAYDKYRIATGNIMPYDAMTQPMRTRIDEPTEPPPTKKATLGFTIIAVPILYCPMFPLGAIKPRRLGCKPLCTCMGIRP
jgi:hypothetical protein